MARVLKPSGKVFSVIPKWDCWKFPYEERGVVQFLGEFVTRGLFEDAGIDLILGHMSVTFSISKPAISLWLVDGTKRVDPEPDSA